LQYKWTLVPYRTTGGTLTPVNFRPWLIDTQTPVPVNNNQS
jgi:hypothetical protein